ncbi:MAG: SEC-C metal-binding domain-containing protein, partial [Bacteroidia bacterium]|nr:SEC-C metal-binding domain-containing protein [Bacteroidia bacterium]
PMLRKQVSESFAKQFPDETASAMDGFWDKFDKVDNAAPFTPRPTIGRNDPCPCGSGKKYTKCSGDN